MTRQRSAIGKFNKLLMILLTLSMASSLAACSNGGGGADIAITDAAVYTADGDGTIEEAVVIEDGKIVYVGNSQGAEEFIGSDTKAIDLDGGTVMPGLVDSHMHPVLGAVSYLYEINLADSVGLDAYLETIGKFVKENPDLNAYVGVGFMRSEFDVVGPRKELLDKIMPDKPMMIRSADGHSLWVNSKAMELAGITAGTSDPEGGVIQRDPATGEPAGLLQESAMELVADLKPEYTKEQYKEAILWLQDWFNSVGTTTVFDAMVDIDKPAVYEAYQELAESGELSMRVRGAWYMYPEMGPDKFDSYIDKGAALSSGFKTPYFQMNAFKFFVDQVAEEATAYMDEPYEGRTDGWRGIKVWDGDVLADLFTKIDSKGFQLHIHQIGDAAATYALDAVEAAAKANGTRDSRHTFAHVQFMKDADIQRMADLKMNAVIAPYWMAMDDYYWDVYLPLLGEERVNNMYPAQSLVDGGVNVAVHSDFFVTEPDPGWLLYSAVTRTLPQRMADVWYEGMDVTRTTDIEHPMEDFLIGPLPPHDERLTLEEAVMAATYNGSYANFMENEIGSLEEGKYADIILFEDNIFDLDIEDVANAAPIMTIFDGRVVYDAAEAE